MTRKTVGAIIKTVQEAEPKRKEIRTMKKYSVATPERLRSLCIRKQWFTCGTNEQYEKLFYANEMGCPIEEIATIIWLCSDSEVHCRRDILSELNRELEEYLIDVADEMVANGERTADEIYCGYFD